MDINTIFILVGVVITIWYVNSKIQDRKKRKIDDAEFEKELARRRRDISCDHKAWEDKFHK